MYENSNFLAVVAVGNIENDSPAMITDPATSKNALVGAFLEFIFVLFFISCFLTRAITIFYHDSKIYIINQLEQVKTMVRLLSLHKKEKII